AARAPPPAAWMRGRPRAAWRRRRWLFCIARESCNPLVCCVFAICQGNLHSTYSSSAKALRLLTLARDLRRRKARETRGLFTIEGTRAVEELLASDLRIHGAIHHFGYGDSEREQGVLSRLRELGVETIRVREEDLKS